MKIDYNQLMKQQISSFGFKPRLLLHCCCAPCSSAVIERIKEFFDITFYYYNPNIFPKEEYDIRLAEFEKLKVDVVSEIYKHEIFLNSVKGLEQEPEGGSRCRVCIAERLKQSFKYAKQHNFDYVTTTLSISPHKDAEFINKVGEQFQKEFNVKFLYADFKKENGYLSSIKICKDLQIYRQEYCGCEFAKNKN